MAVRKPETLEAQSRPKAQRASERRQGTLLFPETRSIDRDRRAPQIGHLNCTGEINFPWLGLPRYCCQINPRVSPPGAACFRNYFLKIDAPASLNPLNPAHSSISPPCAPRGLLRHDQSGGILTTSPTKSRAQSATSALSLAQVIDLYETERGERVGRHGF